MNHACLDMVRDDLNPVEIKYYPLMISLDKDTVKSVVCNAYMSWSFYFIKYWAPCLSWENKSDLRDNLNNFFAKVPFS